MNSEQLKRGGHFPDPCSGSAPLFWPPLQPGPKVPAYPPAGGGVVDVKEKTLRTHQVLRGSESRAGAYKKGREEFKHDEPKVRRHKPNEWVC
jgi:hypothetical protein